MHDPAQIARLAEGLSEAEREWVCSPDRFADGNEWADGDCLWNAMYNAGLAEFWTDRLTPLGLEVRQYLARPRAHLTAAQEKKDG